MGKKILFLDLDGTLLNDAKEITSGNRTALNRALEDGHRVVIATGRPLSSALQQARKLGLDGPGCYVIAFNGGLVYEPSEEKIIFGSTLEIPTALALIRLGDALNIHVQTYDDQDVLVEPQWDDAYLNYYCSRILIRHRVVDSMEAALVKEPAKVLAMGLNQQALLPMKQEIEKHFSDKVDCFYSDERLLEIVPKGMNKGNAIRWTCKTLGIDIVDSIAVGDAENDLSMIEAAGTGVAMRNGTDKVKAAADYITVLDNNHDGIAEVVEKFIFSI